MNYAKGSKKYFLTSKFELFFCLSARAFFKKKVDIILYYWKKIVYLSEILQITNTNPWQPVQYTDSPIEMNGSLVKAQLLIHSWGFYGER